MSIKSRIVGSNSRRKDPYADYLNQQYEILEDGLIYEIKYTNNKTINRTITGTYVPDDLILDIATWVSNEFYTKCNKIIKAYCIHEQEEKFKTQLNLKNQELQVKEEELQTKNQELQVKEEALKKSQKYALTLKEIMVKSEPIQKIQVIYIATSKLYAQQNLFKVGGVESEDKLKSRFSTYIQEE